MIQTKVKPQKAEKKQERSIAEWALFEIFFMNVGQGNCTILKIYKSSKVYYCWVFDAGSLHAPSYGKLGIKETTNKELAEKFLKVIGFPERLIFVFSHPDMDHYNLFPLILNTYYEGKNKKFRWNDRKKQITIIINNIHSTQYKEIECLKDIFNDSDYEVECINTKPQLMEENSFYWSGRRGGRNVNFLTYEPIHKGDTQDFLKNSNSLVAHIEYNEKHILLTGDATSATFDNIFEHPLPFSGELLCYQISHHGSHHCTKKEYLEFFKPELIFISSHLLSKYDHPHFDVIDTIFEYLHERKSTTHLQKWHIVPCKRKVNHNEWSRGKYLMNQYHIIPLL
jgi:hypothetical protein